MPIDLTSIGYQVGPAEQRYDWRDTALYALGLAAGTGDLGYLLDPTPKVLPTYGVIPAFAPVFDAMRRTEGDLVQLLHTGQRIELLGPFPASGTLSTTAKI